MEEKLVKKCATKTCAKKPAAKNVGKTASTSKSDNKKSSQTSKSTKTSSASKKSAAQAKVSKPVEIKNVGKQQTKPAAKKEVKKKVSFTIFELRDLGAKLFESENQKFNAVVNVVSRELRKDNYGIAHDFAESNLRREEFNGYEQGCLGSICGCITAYLVELHIQQNNEKKETVSV